MVAEIMATDLQAARIFDDRVEQVKKAFNELGRESERWPTVANVIKKLKNSVPKAHQLFPVTEEGRACLEVAQKHIQDMKEKGYCGLTESVSDEDEEKLLSKAEQLYESVNKAQIEEDLDR